MKLGLVVAIIEPRISLTLFDSSYHKTTMAQNQVYWLNPFIRKSSLQSKSCGKLVWQFVLHLFRSFNMVTMTSELELSPLGGIETESNFSFRALGQLAPTKKLWQAHQNFITGFQIMELLNLGLFGRGKKARCFAWKGTSSNPCIINYFW